MMTLSSTLSRYLARAWLTGFLYILLALLGVVYLLDTVELLRRADKEEAVPLSLVLGMGLLKLPEVGQLLLPFAVLFGAMFAFWKLNRRSELIVMRSAGFSIWQLLTPVLTAAILTGIIYLAVINPIGASMIGRFEVLEDRYLSHRSSSVTLLKAGLWLRQDQPDGRVIVHAGRVDLPAWMLHDVMVLYFSGDDSFKQRLDAPSARLKDGQWVFENVISNAPGMKAERVASVSLPTDLTSTEIEESFSSPSAISSWALPGFIDTMEETGFDATGLKIHFNALLAQPLMFAAMILLAAAVSLRPPRFRGVFVMVIAGAAGGFAVFFAASFLQALGTSHQIPVLAASWAPPIVTVLVGTAILLNIEDG